MVPCFHYLRLWDVSAANRVDNFLTISHAVQARVKRWWKRDSAILYPPVDMDRLAAAPDDGFHPVSVLLDIRNFCETAG